MAKSPRSRRRTAPPSKDRENAGSDGVIVARERRQDARGSPMQEAVYRAALARAEISWPAPVVKSGADRRPRPSSWWTPGSTILRVHGHHCAEPVRLV